jgi:hypothetical protein
LKSSTSFKGRIDMNTTQLHAHGGETSTLTTPTAPRSEPTADCAAGNRAVRQSPIGSGAFEANEVVLMRAGLWIAGLLGLLAVNLLFLALLSVDLLPSPATRAKTIRPAPAAVSNAAGVPSRPQTMQIVPAEAIEQNPVFFIGTGDGSAGSWTRP